MCVDGTIVCHLTAPPKQLSNLLTLTYAADPRPDHDDNNLTLEALVRALQSLEAVGSQDFWLTILRRFNVSKFAFSSHLPDDDHCYIMAAVPELGTPKTMLIPETYRRELPPLPSILDLAAAPTVFMRQGGVYEADGEGIRRVREELDL